LRLVLFGSPANLLAAVRKEKLHHIIPIRFAGDDLSKLDGCPVLIKHFVQSLDGRTPIPCERNSGTEAHSIGTTIIEIRSEAPTQVSKDAFGCIRVAGKSKRYLLVYVVIKRCRHEVAEDRWGCTWIDCDFPADEAKFGLCQLDQHSRIGCRLGTREGMASRRD